MALVVAVVVLIVSYGALVKQTISHTVARKGLESSIVDMSGKVSLLESEYMQRLDKLTLERAYDLGFVEKDVALFVSRRAQGLSRNNNE